MSTFLDITHAYSATVAAPSDTYMMGSPVQLTGRAFDPISGDPAPNQPVTVRVHVRGTRRLVEATSDESGSFVATFQPLPGEAGRYSIGADHPGVATDIDQDSFLIIGMEAGTKQ